MCEWQALVHTSTYQPDTLDLNKDKEAAEYWFSCFRNMVQKSVKQATKSQPNDESAKERSEQFRRSYMNQLETYEANINENAAKNIVLGTRVLLELNELELRRFGFPDPWLMQKQLENTKSISLLKKRLEEVDNIDDMDRRWTELVRGVLAGNMFDWGAEAVANILESDKDFGLHAALDRIESRPWLVDSLDEWLKRMQGTAHKCAIIFVDNSGVDIVLGILPFARELLKRGTKVLLCANTEPSLNDVTCVELKELLNKCTCECTILSMAWSNQRLLVYGNGQRGPCLDMRMLPLDLCQAIRTNETDLLVIEGMGRALHTNLNAQFSCETLKLAVIKNQWLAKRLGGDTFAVMCKYEMVNS